MVFWNKSEKYLHNKSVYEKHNNPPPPSLYMFSAVLRNRKLDPGYYPKKSNSKPVAGKRPAAQCETMFQYFTENIKLKTFS